jgi:hypothetical protein
MSKVSMQKMKTKTNKECAINKRMAPETMQSKNGAPGMHSFTDPCETRQRKVALEPRNESSEGLKKRGEDAEEKALSSHKQPQSPAGAWAI